MFGCGQAICLHSSLNEIYLKFSSALKFIRRLEGSVANMSINQHINYFLHNKSMSKYENAMAYVSRFQVTSPPSIRKSTVKNKLQIFI